MQSAPTPTHRDADTQYYRRVLHDVIDMASDLARLTHRQAIAAAQDPATPQPAPDPTLAFDRVARAIRRTVALARSLNEPAPTPSPKREIARRRILRDVEDAIQRTATGARAEALHAETLDRLDTPDLDPEIDHLPIAQIVADICRDLGIASTGTAHPWKRRTPADIVLLNSNAAAPLSRRAKEGRGKGGIPASNDKAHKPGLPSPHRPWTPRPPLTTVR